MDTLLVKTAAYCPHVGGANSRAVTLILLLAVLSCHQVASASESNLRVEVDTGPVMAIEDVGGTLWIGTATKGLFRWDRAPEGVPQPVAADTGPVYALLADNHVLWIGSGQGLFRWENPDQGGVPQRIPGSPTSVKRLYKFGDRLLISGADGLSIWQNGRLTPPHVVTSPVNAFCQDGEDTVWIGSDSGLFRWKSGDEEPSFVPLDSDVKVTSLYKGGPALLAGTSRGLLRWLDAPNGGREWVLAGPEVTRLHKHVSMLLIGTSGEGLFRLDDIVGGKPTPISGVTGMNTTFFSNGPILWMGAGYVADAGLYRWDVQNEEGPQLVAGMSTRFIHCFYKSGKTLWVGADKGIFRIDLPETKWDANLEIVNKLPLVIYTDNNVLIQWRVGNYRWRTTPEQVHYRIVLKDSNGNAVDLDRGEFFGRQEFILPRLSPGKYVLYIQASDLNGITAVSQPLHFQVYSSLADVILSLAEKIGPGYFILTLVAFLILLLLSRRSQRAFELLTGFWIRKAGLYFGYILCNVSAVRIWVFERYYQRLREEFNEERPYVPKEIETPNGGSISVAELLDHLQSITHILVQGDAGTGKTELLKRVLKVYCEHPTLRSAHKRYGFIPIMIPLREFGDPAAPGDDSTMPSLTRAALKGKGMWFTDEKFFERLLDRKDFLVILDGLNEVNIDRQVIKFAATSPDVRLLMTSQTGLSGSGIQTYRLSVMTPDFAKTLLAAFLRDEPITRSTEDVAESLWGDIKSGYDVRLIQNLMVAGRPLPTNRLELYAATMNYASDRFGGEYPQYVIRRRAWNLWKETKRRFTSDEELTDDLIKPLLETKMVVARSDRFEFRHDLMRGYLAACWAACEAASISETKENLNATAVWNLSASEQDLVFPFLAELLASQEALQALGQFAAEAMDERLRLLVACQEAAKNKGWSIVIHLNEPSPDLLKAL
jgi:hypothetical protein